jgi:hypothetical protein
MSIRITDRNFMPENFFANFSALLPSGEKAVHVQFITTLLGSPFISGPSAYSDSITHAIISYNKREQGEFLIRLAEGTTYGSLSDSFDLYKGRKIAFERALDALREEGSAAALKQFVELYPYGSLEAGERLPMVRKLRDDFRAADKRMRTFMWDKFHKFFPTPESV